MTPSPPGWYPDPWDARTERWYDGRQWTAHVRGRTPPAAAATRPRANPVVVAVVVVVLVTLVAVGLAAWLLHSAYSVMQGVVCGEAPHYCD